LVETLSHILQATPNSLTAMSPNVDAELQAIVLRCLEKTPAARYQTMSQLADALNGYLDARKQSQLDAAPAAAARTTRRPPASAKVRIPGVHSRWPTMLAIMTVLLGAGLYAADHTGRVRLRDLTDGWLTPARLTSDAAPPLAERNGHREDAPFQREMSSTGSLRDGAGRRILRAVPERELLPGVLAPSAEEPPISDQERARRVAAYRDYLKNEGLTKLSDIEAPPSERSAESSPPSDPAAP
jgi:hypothetical protein